MRRYEMTDQEWAKIAPLLAGQVSSAGRKPVDDRLFVNAVLWMARSGAPWRDLPQRFGKWNSNDRRFRRWAQSGAWKLIFEALQEPDLDWPGRRCGDDRLDDGARASTGRRAKKSSPEHQALGRSRGGLTTKIHALVDALGNPVRIEVSPGQAGDAP